MSRSRCVFFLGVAALAALLASPAGAAIPPFEPKPDSWTSTLATNAGPPITDAQFANWVWNLQTMGGMQQANPRFSFLASFGQCYSGGFLTELDRRLPIGPGGALAGVEKFGTNSSARYWEAAYYNTNAVPKQSYYVYAWWKRAVTPRNDNDDVITDGAWTWLTDGLAAPAPDLPAGVAQKAQYRSRGNPPPEKIKAAANNYAILYVGQPDGMPDFMDRNDINQVYAALLLYGYNRNDIYILYGDGLAVAGAPWSPPNGPATAPWLQGAFTNWLAGKIQNQAPNVQVLFWAGDHGGARFPFFMSVDGASLGQPGTGVANVRLAGQPHQNVIYEAGSNTQVPWWTSARGDVDAIAFSEDNVVRWFDTTKGTWIYFSVDRKSVGKPNSDVNREKLRGFSVGSDVFTATDGSNRRLFDGGTDLGLVELPAGNDDELDALALRNSTNVQLDPLTQMPGIPLFYSVRGTANIFVWDPTLGRSYLYYDFTTLPVGADGLRPPPPMELDALAMNDDGVRAMGTNQLTFNPQTDALLFSVGRGEAAAPWNGFAPCDLLKLGRAVLMPQVWRTCDQIGLKPATDDVDALELGLGPEGQPVPYPSSPSPTPWPPRSPGWQPTPLEPEGMQPPDPGPGPIKPPLPDPGMDPGPIKPPPV